MLEAVSHTPLGKFRATDLCNGRASDRHFDHAAFGYLFRDAIKQDLRASLCYRSAAARWSPYGPPYPTAAEWKTPLTRPIDGPAAGPITVDAAGSVYVYVEPLGQIAVVNRSAGLAGSMRVAGTDSGGAVTATPFGVVAMASTRRRIAVDAAVTARR